MFPFSTPTWFHITTWEKRYDREDYRLVKLDRDITGDMVHVYLLL